MGERSIVKRVLRQSDSRQARVVERRAVGPAGSAAVGGDSAHEAPIRKRHQRLTHHVRRARRPKHARTPRFSGARINVEVRVQLRVFRFLVFKTSEMLLYVSERTEQAFFLAAPKRNTNRAPRLQDRKSTRLNSSHQIISYAVFCL